MKVLPGKTTLNWSQCNSYEDILLHKSDEGIARIAINRPEKEMHLDLRLLKNLLMHLIL